jgi:hypothetical protein
LSIGNLKPQRIERRRGKFQSDWNDSRHYTDDDLSDGGHVIQTMVFERQNNNQPESKLTVKLPALGRLMLDNEYLFDPGFPFPFGGFWDRFSTVNLDSG